MKKLFILFTLTLLMSSCGKYPINERLDGMWQLMTLTKNGQETINTKESRIYYNVQLHLFGLQKEGYVEYLGRFIQTTDSLIISDFVVSGNNSVKATEEDLVPFGIYDLSERFGIEKMTDKEMILRSDDALLTFRKF